MKNIHPSLIFAAIIIILAGVMYAESIINPFLMALFMSIICVQPILWLKKKKVPSGAAVGIVVIGILGIYFAFIELVSASVTMFINDAPKYSKALEGLRESVTQILADRNIQIAVLDGSSAVDPSKVMQLTTKLFGGMSDMIGNEFTFLLLTIFLLSELGSISIKAQVFSKTSDKSMEYLNNIGVSIRHYLSIKTFTSFVTGLLIAISLWIIGVDYPILWGLVAFLLNYIPNIGSIIAAIPAVIFSILQLGMMGAVWTTVVFVVVNMVIGNVVECRMMGKGLGLSTFVVFLGLIFWGFILGPVGMFLSVPLMMVIKIVLEQYPDTKWIALWLGTEEEAEKELAK
jgi:AI-2 transport protein TqsA